MQLTDQAVATTSPAGSEVLCLLVIDVRTARYGWEYTAVAVCRFDRGSVENKGNQQQTEPARERCVAVV